MTLFFLLNPKHLNVIPGGSGSGGGELGWKRKRSKKDREFRKGLFAKLRDFPEKTNSLKTLSDIREFARRARLIAEDDDIVVMLFIDDE